MAQYPPASVEEQIQHMQQTIKALQQDAVRQAEVTAHQAEVITWLEQQQPQPAAASASHIPTTGNPIAGAIAHTANVQETQPIPEQASKAPVYQTEAPFEFEVDPTALKVNKLQI